MDKNDHFDQYSINHFNHLIDCGLTGIVSFSGMMAVTTDKFERSSQ